MSTNREISRLARRRALKTAPTALTSDGRLAASSSATVSDVFQYDPAGNLLGNGRTYDGANRLKQIKRYNDDRMVTFQFDGVETPLFVDLAPELPLVPFTLKERKRAKTVTVLIGHRGRISSLEFKVKPSLIDAEGWHRVIAQSNGQDPHVAMSIDREEHGDDA
jgi:hypothetical protein